MNKSLYDILGIPRDASPDVIKRAYRKLASKHHPDRKGGDKETMQQVQGAYDVLSDPDRRREYDLTGKTKPDRHIDEHANQVLVDGFAQYITRASNSDNAIEVIGSGIRTAIRESKAIIEAAPKKCAELERKAKRVKHKDRDKNVYAGVIEQMLQQVEQERAATEQRIPVFERALELLAEYEAHPEEEMVRNFRMQLFTSNGGIDRWEEL